MSFWGSPGFSHDPPSQWVWPRLLLMGLPMTAGMKSDSRFRLTAGFRKADVPAHQDDCGSNLTAIYHVMARGNARQAIVRDDADRRWLIDRLDHAVVNLVTPRPAHAPQIGQAGIGYGEAFQLKRDRTRSAEPARTVHQ